jgi:hypothetical protein
MAYSLTMEGSFSSVIFGLGRSTVSNAGFKGASEVVLETGVGFGSKGANDSA